MKKSEVVLLTLMIGTVAAINMERRPDTVRNVYNSRDDCVHDYSDTQCREDANNSRSGGRGGSSGGRWVGPDYRDDDTRRSSRATDRETVRRGGFGFSGRGAGG